MNLRFWIPTNLLSDADGTGTGLSYDLCVSNMEDIGSKV